MKQKKLSFTDWYKLKYNEKWDQDYALLINFAIGCADEYKAYCKKYNIKPNWDG